MNPFIHHFPPNIYASALYDCCEEKFEREFDVALWDELPEKIKATNERTIAKILSFLNI